MSMVLGQDRVVRSLAMAMSSSRLAHGLLFTGPEGVGRETCARGLATGLLCDLPSTPARLPFGCGTCRSCRRVQTSSHPDFEVVMSEAETVARGGAVDTKNKPSPEIKIDAIRALTQKLHQRPYEGKARVALVVDAHKMNEKAQNALLKGLEEPAAQTVLILLAPGPRAMLPTIASRCQCLTFSPLTPAVVEAILVKQGVSDAHDKAAGRNSVAAALDDDTAHAEAANRLVEALLLDKQNANTLGARLALAEELGRDRAEVDAVFRQAFSILGRRLRHELNDRRVERAVEGLFAARSMLQRNGAVQLVVERLLLAAPPSVLEHHR